LQEFCISDNFMQHRLRLNIISVGMQPGVWINSDLRSELAGMCSSRCSESAPCQLSVRGRELRRLQGALECFARTAAVSRPHQNHSQVILKLSVAWRVRCRITG
jgi:hypothetical protein